MTPEERRAKQARIKAHKAKRLLRRNNQRARFVSEADLRLSDEARERLERLGVTFRA